MRWRRAALCCALGVLLGCDDEQTGRAPPGGGDGGAVEAGSPEAGAPTDADPPDGMSDPMDARPERPADGATMGATDGATDGGPSDGGPPEGGVDRGVWRHPCRPPARTPEIDPWPEQVDFWYEHLPGPPPVARHCESTVRQPIERLRHVVFIGDALLVDPPDPNGLEPSLLEKLTDLLTVHPDFDLERPDREWLAFDGEDPGEPFAVSGSFTVIGKADWTLVDARSTLEAADLAQRVHEAMRPLGRVQQQGDQAPDDAGTILVIVALGQSELRRLFGLLELHGRPDREAVDDWLDGLTDDLDRLIERLGPFVEALGAAHAPILLVNPIDWNLAFEADCPPWSHQRHWPRDGIHDLPVEALLSLWYTAAERHGIDVVFARERAAAHGLAALAGAQWVDARDDASPCLYPNDRGRAALADVLYRAIGERDPIE